MIDNNRLFLVSFFLLFMLFLLDHFRCKWLEIFFLSRLSNHPDIMTMGDKEIHYWDRVQEYPNQVYDFERYLDVADIGADKVVRNARMSRLTNEIYYPVIFGDGTPSTIFKNNKWRRYVSLSSIRVFLLIQS